MTSLHFDYFFSFFFLFLLVGSFADIDVVACAATTADFCSCSSLFVFSFFDDEGQFPSVPMVMLDRTVVVIELRDFPVAISFVTSALVLYTFAFKLRSLKRLAVSFHIAHISFNTQ